VLDFSAGWGDRLIGAIASDVQLYVGVDPNTDLEPGHSEAIGTLVPDTEKRKNFRLLYEPFQKCELPVELTFDLIFTSPPFFNFEIYTEKEGQSVKDYPKFSDWLVYFLLMSLKKAWKKLDISGHMAIHLTDTRGSQVCEVMNLFVQSRLEGAVYEGVIASRSKNVSDLPRPIWVWLKKDPNDFNDLERFRVSQSKEYFQKYFGDTYDVVSKM